MVWEDYPKCGCRCREINRTCPNGQYWDLGSCSCKCSKKCCPSGTTQNMNTCQCSSGSGSGNCPIPFVPCEGNTIWDPSQCQCIPKCLPFAPCPSGQTWNFLTCRCECNQAAISCPIGQYVNPETCSCQSRCNLLRILCPPGTSMNQETCRC